MRPGPVPYLLCEVPDRSMGARWASVPPAGPGCLWRARGRAGRAPCDLVPLGVLLTLLTGSGPAMPAWAG